VKEAFPTTPARLLDAMLAVQAVSSEPLSGPNSLLTENFTGKSSNLPRSVPQSRACMLHN
jgi:hypothetical protein